MDYVPEVAGLLGVVFVVWRMLTYYEKRNADAHAELGKRIDAVAADVSVVAGDVKYMRGVLDTLLASAPKRLAGSAFRPIPPAP